MNCYWTEGQDCCRDDFAPENVNNLPLHVAVSPGLLKHALITSTSVVRAVHLSLVQTPSSREGRLLPPLYVAEKNIDSYYLTSLGVT